MASCVSIHGSPIGAFKHDFRERDVYRNEDIIKEKSHMNYTLSHNGKTSKECMSYYDSLLSDVYHREGSTITTCEWSIQVPEDLPANREEDFFKSTYDFLNEYHFGGDDSRCLLAQVHRDEIGQSHEHYVFTFPEVDNEKYVNFNEKLLDGLHKSVEKYELKLTEKQIIDCRHVLERFESRADKNRERDAIREFGRILDLKRDDARWCFTRARRLESERYKKRLMSKDEFMTPTMFKEFHPAYQKWLDDHGFSCTVYRGGGGINLSVEQLKEITRQTGVVLDKGLSVKTIANLINDNKRLHEKVQQLEKERAVSNSHTWGDVSNWGSSVKGAEKEWER